MDTKKMKLFGNIADVEKAVGVITKSAGKIQDDIHRAAVSVIKLWHDKVIQPVDAAKILSALQGASPYHQNAFSRWVGEFTNFQWSKEKKVWFAHPSDDNVLKGKTFMAARDTPFWKVAPEPEAKPFDMMADLDRIIERATKRMEKPVEGDKIDAEVLRQLRDLRTAMKASVEVDH